MPMVASDDGDGCRRRPMSGDLEGGGSARSGGLERQTACRKWRRKGVIEGWVDGLIDSEGDDNK